MVVLKRKGSIKNHFRSFVNNLSELFGMMEKFWVMKVATQPRNNNDFSGNCRRTIVSSCPSLRICLDARSYFERAFVLLDDNVVK